MNADFNQVLMQHFPKVRRQDLRLIYRLLLLKSVPSNRVTKELEALNEPTKKNHRNADAFPIILIKRNDCENVVSFYYFSWVTTTCHCFNS